MEPETDDNDASGFRDYNIFNYYDTRKIVQIMFLIVAFCLGVPTNLLSLAISLKRQRNAAKRFHLLQVHRSLADLLFLMVFIPTQLFHELDSPNWKTGGFLCKLFRFSRNFAYQASSNLIVAIAIDRWRGLRSAVSGTSWSKESLRRTIILAWLMAVLLSSPQFILARVSQLAGSNMCTHVWVPTNITSPEFFQFMKESNPGERLFIVERALCLFWIPLITITAIYRKIWLLLRQRNSSMIDSSSVKRDRSSLMLKVLKRRTKPTDVLASMPAEQNSIDR